MFTRFTNIIGGLRSLEKSYTNNELVCKILGSFPRAWEAKVIAIQEVKDLDTLPLKELLDLLMTLELTMKQNNENEAKKKKTIALKLGAKNEKESEKSKKDDKEDMALITQKF